MTSLNTTLNDIIIQLQSQICFLEDFISERNELITYLEVLYSDILARKIRFEALMGTRHAHEPDDIVRYQSICFMLLDIEACIEEMRDRLLDYDMEFDGLWRQLRAAVLAEQ
ncbi:uncharacterized protein H6S33_000160 [Morchella sextelata]|jgi:hypothetical protein|uniref:uncharacterized protein n=1 Tax=Morchella sextelata TaxID=1174677 RepID=UPI001D03B655|nr:uncharacterized protein H6S33_000160 [Morchella sextelata]KAH0614524.1 hypothetical protein H6S33_000160 [Morchella sextelata]